ncbi:uncharacterized protein TNCV_1124571 [Trichonephila clavipes]|uniref:Uncharacterized protein n=1 Tax=Trichonephila clavipes TaxID=2585209 RepID=A0A8X6SGT6_TRICX|nr:uncharacterized protein TNCV_1124571 [Trichonephila clavipes]
MSEGRFVQGNFRSERMRGLYRSRQNNRLRMMLVLVHIDITPPHTPLSVFWRIDERTIPYSWRALKRAMVNSVQSSKFQDRRLESDGTMCSNSHPNDTKVGGKVRSGYLAFRTRMRGLY